MIFKIPELIAYCSSIITLEKGDLIITGMYSLLFFWPSILSLVRTLLTFFFFFWWYFFRYTWRSRTSCRWRCCYSWNSTRWKGYFNYGTYYGRKGYYLQDLIDIYYWNALYTWKFSFFLSLFEKASDHFSQRLDLRLKSKFETRKWKRVWKHVALLESYRTPVLYYSEKIIRWCTYVCT